MHIFYSWQSDLPKTKTLINECLQEAVERLNSESPIEEAERPGESNSESETSLTDFARLDSDTKGISGTPSIAEVIFKKIRDCDVFVADVSFVGQRKDNGRKIANPNVLIELGYALGVSPDGDKIITILDETTGSKSHLPFDLRGRRFPISVRDDPASREKCIGALVEAFKPFLKEIGRKSLEKTQENCDQWVEQRMKKIRSGRGLAELDSSNNPKLIIHVVPLDSSLFFEVEELQKYCCFMPIYESLRSYTHSPNENGLICIDKKRQRARGYIQTFQDGKIESVRNLTLYDNHGKNSLNGRQVDSIILHAIQDFSNALQSLGVTAPVQIYVSFLDLNGICLLYKGQAIGVREISCEPVKLDTLDFSVESPPAGIKKVLDKLWNAAGHTKSSTINADGSAELMKLM